MKQFWNFKPLDLKRTTTPKAQGTLWKRGTERLEDQEDAWVQLLIFSGYTDLLTWLPNVSQTRMTPIYMQKWIPGGQRGLKPWQTTQATKSCWEWGKLFLARQLFVQCQAISPENMHASNITQTKQIIFRNTYIYINIYTYIYIYINIYI